MHEFLRAIGFSAIHNRKQEEALYECVIEEPDRVKEVNVSADRQIVVIEKDFSPYIGITVVGEPGENGHISAEYLFPYVKTEIIASEGRLSFEPMAARTGYSGMCEDNRFGMALIFDVRNISDVAKYDYGLDDDDKPFSKVSLSMLLSDATVLLPLSSTGKVRPSEPADFVDKITENSDVNDIEQMERVAREELARFENAMKRVKETDVLSVVDNFFMPHGMESDRYYFMGTIRMTMPFYNRVTRENCYLFIIESNGMRFVASVNANDLEGTPAPGYRIKGHGLLQGEMKR